jgi:hypothetical protein
MRGSTEKSITKYNILGRVLEWKGSLGRLSIVRRMIPK